MLEETIITTQEVTPEIAKNYLAREGKNESVFQANVDKFILDLGKDRWKLEKRGILLGHTEKVIFGAGILANIVKNDTPDLIYIFKSDINDYLSNNVIGRLRSTANFIVKTFFNNDITLVEDISKIIEGSVVSLFVEGSHENRRGIAIASVITGFTIALYTFSDASDKIIWMYGRLASGNYSAFEKMILEKLMHHFEDAGSRRDRTPDIDKNIIRAIIYATNPRHIDKESISFKTEDVEVCDEKIKEFVNFLRRTKNLPKSEYQQTILDNSILDKLKKK